MLTARLVLSLKSLGPLNASRSLNASLPNIAMQTNSFLGNIGAALHAPGEDILEDEVNDQEDSQDGGGTDIGTNAEGSGLP